MRRRPLSQFKPALQAVNSDRGTYKSDKSENKSDKSENRELQKQLENRIKKKDGLTKKEDITLESCLTSPGLRP